MENFKHYLELVYVERTLMEVKSLQCGKATRTPKMIEVSSKVDFFILDVTPPSQGCVKERNFLVNTRKRGNMHGIQASSIPPQNSWREQYH